DSGRGIPTEMLPNIFDRFFQADNSETREQEGTGIGLALTKELAELMGGTVSVQSTPGSGSYFTVTLPMPPADPPKEMAEADYRPAGADNISGISREDNYSSDASVAQEAPVILIVEDNEIGRAHV